MNATLNLSVALHQEPIMTHQVKEVREEVDVLLSQSHAVTQELAEKRAENPKTEDYLPMIPVTHTPYTDMDGIFLAPHHHFTDQWDFRDPKVVELLKLVGAHLEVVEWVEGMSEWIEIFGTFTLALQRYA